MKQIILATTLSILLAGCITESERPDLESKLAQRIDIHTKLGATYITRNQLDVASQELELALELDNNDSQANHYMGLLQIRLKNQEKGEKYLRRAISLKPDNAEARNSYGIYLCEQGKHDEADEQFREALKTPLYQFSDQANVNAGICVLKKPDRSAATKYFRTALQINPKHPSALLNMARLSFTSGEYLGARAFMQRYLEVSSDSPEILLLAFKVERALGSKDAQAKYAIKLRGKFPDSDEAKELRSITGYK